jgi:hypothetical protein
MQYRKFRPLIQGVLIALSIELGAFIGHCIGQALAHGGH